MNISNWRKWYEAEHSVVIGLWNRSLTLAFNLSSVFYIAKLYIHIKGEYREYRVCFCPSIYGWIPKGITAHYLSTISLDLPWRNK